MSDAAVIARARALWPALTTAAASDTFLSAWLVQARHLAASPRWGALQLDATAHALAHFAYRVDPAGLLTGGGASAGPVTSLSTLGLSASFAGPAAAQQRSAADAELATTPPGRAFLALRASVASFSAPRVYG